MIDRQYYRIKMLRREPNIVWTFNFKFKKYDAIFFSFLCSVRPPQNAHFIAYLLVKNSHKLSRLILGCRVLFIIGAVLFELRFKVNIVEINLCRLCAFFTMRRAGCWFENLKTTIRTRISEYRENQRAHFYAFLILTLNEIMRFSSRCKTAPALLYSPQ